MLSALVPVVSITLAVAPAPSPEPAAVVRALFADHFKHEMGFTKASVARKAKWLTADFLQRLNTELERPSSPDEVPNIDGDPFTDSQEYPTKFTVGKPSTVGGAAKVPVTLTGNGRRTTIFAILHHGQDGWQVDDIVYQDGRTLRSYLGQ